MLIPFAYPDMMGTPEFGAYALATPLAFDDMTDILAYDASAFPLVSDDMTGKPAFDALAFYGMKDTLAFEASALALGE